MLMSTTASSFFSSKPLPLPRIPTLSRPQLISTRHASIFSSNSKAWATKTTINASSSESQTVSVAPSVESASDVVRSFYGGINGHDLGSVAELIAENCVYEDLIFSRPFVGRKAILEFFNKFIDTISKDLQFVIDDISNEDSFAVGVTWHLEWKGKTFPFSKGCSFYRLDVVNGKRKIIYGRDSVEPAVKPGEAALVAIRGVTWLLQRFPQLADQL
ncbi:NUCLEAR TRANSPORT FACTOR 2 (NTF2)-LIKE PROTEIN [Salix purpurea]|uniref:NUCLEAR TRANSPORT FACTOR 2 (NTF2)-LIKE PROTEIN n=1 Tax=Salix purpurea TaxID=77065 RepID=A0A9Q0V9Q5_SALPP|nr:NUCLEAR TRANSPORT FACTOR 2 (NTF2)-LIKE PROTEIN [Salix purpurea]